MPFDGMLGGVLCIIVQNNLQMTTGIDVTAKGFQGAIPDLSLITDCSYNLTSFQRWSYSGISDSAGFKGQGVFADPLGILACGRGKIANGGGGGNGLFAAGGGGGNGGEGGKGGAEYSSCATFLDMGGLGGAPLNSFYGSGKIFMGGGGGAGTYHLVTDDPVPGGNGGGIAIIIAGSILSSSAVIQAKGGDAVGITNEGSAGGGGAGGSILL